MEMEMEELPPDFLSLGLGHAPFPTRTAPPARAPPALLDEIVEEILLRVPPTDPARLLRAALVCKQWARLLADADRGFQRRYRERHGAMGLAPLLGFLANLVATGGSARFVPTLAFSPGRASHRSYRAHDARHGRVLLNRITWARRHGVQDDHDADALALWDPVTDDLQPLPLLSRSQQVRSWNAAVLCAAAGCTHVDCRPGHFLVAFVGIDAKEMFAHVYSSESAAWGEATSAHPPLPAEHLDDAMPGALAGNALYFLLQMGYRMLKYDLDTRKLSLVLIPNRPYARRLMAMEDGGLGFAEVDAQYCTLKLWSMETHPDGVEGKWTVSRAINLNMKLPAPALGAPPFVVAIADLVGVIFLKTTGGLYTYHLKTGQSIRVMTDDFYDIIPYMGFYTPVLRVASTGEGPSGTSTA